MKISIVSSFKFFFYYNRNVKFWMICLTYGVSLGVYNCWQSVLDVILKPHGISEVSELYQILKILTRSVVLFIASLAECYTPGSSAGEIATMSQRCIVYKFLLIKIWAKRIIIINFSWYKCFHIMHQINLGN